VRRVHILLLGAFDELLLLDQWQELCYLLPQHVELTLSVVSDTIPEHMHRTRYSLSSATRQQSAIGGGLRFHRGPAVLEPVCDHEAELVGDTEQDSPPKRERDPECDSERGAECDSERGAEQEQEQPNPIDTATEGAVTQERHNHAENPNQRTAGLELTFLNGHLAVWYDELHASRPVDLILSLDAGLSQPRADHMWDRSIGKYLQLDGAESPPWYVSDETQYSVELDRRQFESFAEQLSRVPASLFAGNKPPAPRVHPLVLNPFRAPLLHRGLSDHMARSSSAFLFRVDKQKH